MLRATMWFSAISEYIIFVESFSIHFPVESTVRAVDAN